MKGKGLEYPSKIIKTINESSIKPQMSAIDDEELREDLLKLTDTARIDIDRLKHYYDSKIYVKRR